MSVAGDIGEAALRRLIQWGPEAAASAEDVARFGPNAARVRALLEFLPTMSDEAALLSNRARAANVLKQQSELYDAANKAAFSAMENAGRWEPWNSSLNAATDWRNSYARMLSGSAGDAAVTESIADLVTPETYTTLTNPLAAGRAVDLLRNRPRFQNTPFLDVVRQAGERGAVRGPRDVVAAGRIARSPEDIREIAMTLMADGMPAEEAMRTARLL